MGRKEGERKMEEKQEEDERTENIRWREEVARERYRIGAKLFCRNDRTRPSETYFNVSLCPIRL
jgi:hypothetical protein